MTERPNRFRQLTDSFGLEIDRLIRTLPGADPTLRGDPSPARASAAVPGPIGPVNPPRGGTAGPATSTGSVPGIGGLAPRTVEIIGTWLRTAAASGLGAAVLYWPYAHECGWLLHLYLGVIAAVLVSGAWASVTAWRARVAVAHVLALIVMFWGVVLAAEQLLPRIGYAAVGAAWRCAG
jgi:hypothetical protein